MLLFLKSWISFRDNEKYENRLWRLRSSALFRSKRSFLVSISVPPLVKRHTHRIIPQPSADAILFHWNGVKHKVHPRICSNLNWLPVRAHSLWLMFTRGRAHPSLANSCSDTCVYIKQLESHFRCSAAANGSYKSCGSRDGNGVATGNKQTNTATYLL